MPGMSEARASLAAVTAGGYIYAIGGVAEVRLSSVERYSISGRHWEQVLGMNKARSYACAVILDQHSIYVMGGKSYADNQQCGGARKVLRSCEMYDTEHPEEGWTYIEDMDTARCLFTAVPF